MTGGLDDSLGPDAGVGGAGPSEVSSKPVGFGVVAVVRVLPGHRPSPLASASATVGDGPPEWLRPA